MTPLLAILLLATPPTTINPTPHHQEPTTMAQPLGNAPGGGNNRTNRGHGPTISYPIRHPNTNDPHGPGTAASRVGMTANHPIIEHTARPTLRP